MLELLNWLNQPGLGAAMTLIVIVAILLDQLELNIGGKSVSKALLLLLGALALALAVVSFSLPTAIPVAEVFAEEPSIWSVISADFESWFGFIALVAELWLVGFIAAVLVPKSSLS